MSVEYKDYYKILGVERGADDAEIKKAYRRLARELHPDVNDSQEASLRFRDVNEAYEVLSDKEKRRRYDQLGARWQHGAPFTPPSGFEGFEFEIGGFPPGGRGSVEDLFGGGGGHAGGFSSFFDALFSQVGSRARTRARKGQDLNAEIELGVADLLRGGSRRMTLSLPRAGGGSEERSVTVNLPRGIRPGQKLRLAGQGGASVGGGPAGDLLLKIKLRPEPGLEVQGDDLIIETKISAARAVVGGHLSVDTPEGPLVVNVAPGTQNGTLLRIRGKGLPKKDDSRGDLKIRLRLVIPEKPSREERELYERLAKLES